MGQLIKLQDYISRYEQNIYLYPSRFVRLKKQQWEKLSISWENRSQLPDIDPMFSFELLEENDKSPFFDKLKNLLKRKKEETVISEDITPLHTEEAEEAQLFANPSLMMKNCETIDDLKYKFLDEIFHFQLKWASSTITEMSYVKKRYVYDERLKFFLQRLPDTYLVMYHPILLLKKAPVEIETILISPTDVYCITFVEEQNSAVFGGAKGRFWEVRTQRGNKKILNPTLALNRTEKIIRNIFSMHEIDLPIHKLILSRNGYIDYPTAPYDLKIIEKRNYPEWFQSLRSLRSPLKRMQLKAAQVLLNYSQTTAARRIEWEAGDEE